MQALVSIIIPCFNSKKWISQTLNSVVSQTYKNWECIIVDDGSTDEVEKELSKWLIKDCRFKVLRQDNQGVATARNNGIEASQGEILLTLDSDDLISADYLELAVEIFNSNPSAKVIYSRANKFGEINKEWNLPQYSIKNLAINNVIFNAGFFRKSDWLNVGGFDSNINGMEDWEFWIAILKEGGEVVKIDKVCFHYRIRKNSRNHKLNKMQIDDVQKYITLKHIDFYMDQFGSYPSLAKKVEDIKLSFAYKLKSEKFIINLFTKRFLGFIIFKNVKYY